MCSEKEVFFEISLNSQEKICAGVFCNKAEGFQASTLLKRDSSTGVYLGI